MAALRPLVPVTSADLESLRPGGLITEWVIDAFLRIVERRSIYPGLLSVFSFSVGFRYEWLEGGYPAVEDQLADVNLFSKDLLVFPLHLPYISAVGHWSLIIVRPTAEEVRAYDPTAEDLMPEMEWVMEFLSEHAAHRGVSFRREAWRLIETPREVPKQLDDSSCGAYVCVYADRFARNQIFTRPFCPNTARRAIYRVLLHGKFDTEEFDMLEPTHWHSHGRFSTAPSPLQPPTSVTYSPREDVTLGPFSAHDPLLEALNQAIGDSSPRPYIQLFPPLVKTMGDCPAPSHPPATSEPPKTASTPEPEDDDVLDLDTSDVEMEDYEEPAPSVPTPHVSTPTELAVPVEVSLVGQAGPSRKEPPPHLPVPMEIRRILADSDPAQTRKQKKDQRLKVYRPDGTFFRMRIKKLRTLKSIH